MKALILFLLLLTVLFSNSAVDVSQSQEVKAQGTPLPIVQLGPRRSGPHTSYIANSGFPDRRRMVIRDRPTWAEVWRQMHSGNVSFSYSGPGSEPVISVPPPLPEIDFFRNMVLVVTMGSEPTGGYAIVIDGVYERANQLEVVVRNISPGRNCFTFPAATRPADIVELVRREGSVVFRDIDTVTDCSQTQPDP